MNNNNQVEVEVIKFKWIRKAFIIFIIFGLVLTLTISIYFCAIKKEKPKTIIPIDDIKIQKDKLLIIMLDGFKAEYLESHENLTGFRRLMSEGAMAKWLEPIFPSLSYPCWTTLTTGLYAESHGIIGNEMFDSSMPEESAYFSLGNSTSTSQAHWWKAEQIWTTATKNGKRVFGRQWSRCDVEFEGVKPKDCIGYFAGQGNSTKFQEMIKQVVDKFNDFDLFMIYAEDIDLAGHKFGSNDEPLSALIKVYDTILNDFLTTLDSMKMSQKLNIIIFGDHGMMDVSNLITIEEYIDKNDVQLITGGGATMGVLTKPGMLYKVYEAAKRVPGVKTFLKAEIPENYHFRNARLVLEILLIAEPGFYMNMVSWGKPGGGSHGYDPLSSHMRTILMGRGPAFRPETIVEGMNMVDVYQMYGKLLQIKLNPHNGTWSRVASMFY